MHSTSHYLIALPGPLVGRSYYVWPLLLSWTCSAQAQGQGSYGGIASGFVELALIVILVIAALAVVAVRQASGNKAALRLLALFGAGFVCLVVYSNFSEARRLRAHKEITHALAEGCAETSRVIDHAANGDERIYFRLQGADQIPEYQQAELRPSSNFPAEGVEVVANVPPDAANAVVIDVLYSRELLPGSYRGYEWHRTRYDLRATTVPEGRLLARTLDMEARNGFCLGDLDAFLQKALRRKSVLRAGSSNFREHGIPDAYVRATYDGTTQGEFLKSSKPQDTKQVLVSQGCLATEPTLSLPVAICDGPSGSVEVPLYGILGVYALPSSWLLTYRIDLGMASLTSLRIEQRLADWRPVRTWRANIAASSDTDGMERLDEISVDGEAMTASVYWGAQWDMQHGQWYVNKSRLNVPLPGIAK